MRVNFLKIIICLLLWISPQVFSKSQFTLPSVLFSDLSKVELINERMQLSLKSSKSMYKIGEYLALEINSNKDCYLTIIDIGSSGNAYILYPNIYQKKNVLKAGENLKIPSSKFDIQVGEPIGIERIWAICRIDNQPVISQGYTFGQNIFISLGRITSITQLDGISKRFSENKEIRQSLSIHIVQ